MEFDQQILWDAVGYMAAGLVFSTFYMRTMVPLRIVAIISNLAFLTYGALLHLWPITILHGTLLPLNFWRLQQIRRMLGDLKTAKVGEFDLSKLMPLMRRETHRAGTVLFNRDDVADKAYYISSGVIELPDIPTELREGCLFGEVGLFAAAKNRTSTAVCKSDVALYSLDKSAIATAFHQHPSFAFYLIALISDRLNANHRRLYASAEEDVGAALQEMSTA